MNNTKNVYCRLCAELKPYNELTNLQTDEEMCHKVVNKLSRFNIVLDFQENILPKTVCLLCVKSLERAFTFVTAVDEAQAFLSDFILVKIRHEKSDSYVENIYEPSDHNKITIDVKLENTRDPMEINDDDSKLSEEGNNEVNCNVYNDYSGLNTGREQYNIEIKPTTQFPNVFIEEKVIKKDESDVNNIEDKSKIMVREAFDLNNDFRQNHDINITENNFNIKDKNVTFMKDNKLEIEYNSEPIPSLDNTVYSADYINQQNHSTVGTINKGTDIKHKERKTSKRIPPKLLDNTVYSEDYINKQINRLSIVPVQYLKMTWMDYEWKCSHCGTIFSNIDELQKHSIQYHNSCNPYQCTDCKIKKQRLNAFIKHVRTHRKYLHYSCYKCFEKFPKQIETKQHRGKVHENSNYICLGCNTPFSSNNELDEHVNKYYNILWRQKTFLTNDNLTCNTCKKVCANIAALRNHLNTHKEKNRDHICDRCGKSFFSKPSLRVHMVTHSEKILYRCEICKASFKSKYTLRDHTSIHLGIKPVTCDVCGKGFRNKGQILNHMKIHSDTFPITCTVCNKRFRTDPNLQNHMLQHTGEKPFSCDICPRDFTNLSNRNKHMRRRHGIEMVKKRQHYDVDNGEIEVSEQDKINEWKKKIKEHGESRPEINKMIEKLEVISKDCNEY